LQRRHPRPQESLVFTPDQGAATVLTDDDVRDILVEGMNEAEVDARFVYAFKLTGMLPLSGNEANWTAEQWAVWDAALGQYDALMAKARPV
jgi:hypothetical protein